MLEFLTHSAWADRIGWMLVHSLWQFTLVALAAIVLRRALQRCSATIWYGALLTAMIVMVAMPVATWFSPWLVDAPAVAVKPEPVENLENTPPPQPFEDLMPMAAMPLPSPVEPAEKLQTEPAPLRSQPIGLASAWSMVKSHVQPWLPEIVLIWLAGVLVVAMRLLLSWHTARRLRRVGVSPAGGSVQGVLERTAEKLRLVRAVEVLQSTLVRTPVVLGYFRPLVLLPACVVTGLPPDQLESILAHELAHIRRHDYLVNLLQTLVETLFFYHPAVWWLSRQIRNERENCCDDMAIATVGNRADYGRALLAIEELRATSPSLSLAASDGSLLARIRRIAGCEPTPRVVGGSSILGVILVSLAIAVASTWGAAPTAEKQEANNSSQKTPAAKPAGEASPAKDSAETKVGASADSKPAPADGPAADGNSDQAKAIAAIRKRYGKITMDQKSPGGPVVKSVWLSMATDDDLEPLKYLPRLQSLGLSGAWSTDAGMANLIGLTELQTLDLGNTKITDAGLEHLRGLLQLRTLNLTRTGVTDAGLVLLKRLTKLQRLYLGDTEVTDAGLAHLKGLSQLEMLDLRGTTVTDAGLEHFKGLTKLQELGLDKTHVTVAGLEHLKGLNNFRLLRLEGTQVTDSEAKKLQQELPNCKILRPSDERTKLIAELGKLGVRSPASSMGQVILSRSKSADSALAMLISLDALSNVESLELGASSVSDAGLDHLKGLTKLRRLRLYATEVTDAGLAHLKGLPQLRTLDLSDTNVTDAGLVHLEGLTTLQSLSLGETEITDTGLEHLKGLSQLEMLDLRGTKVTDAGLVHLKGLTKLQSLTLDNTHVTGPGLEHLKDVPQGQITILGSHNLKGLPQRRLAVSLSNTQITDASLEHLKALTNLGVLNLRETKVSDAGLEHLKGLTNLRNLVLSGTEITDAGLVHLKGLPQLQMLDLTDTKITDAGLVHLKDLRQLRALVLNQTRVTDAGLEHLKMLTDLTGLIMEDTKVTDAGLANLRGLTKLTTLNLTGTQITGAGLANLRGLTNVSSLNLCLGRTKITDAGLANLARLTNLWTLDLTETQITDAGLENLRGLSRLASLSVGGTRVTEAGVKKLQQALPYCGIGRTDRPRPAKNGATSTVPSRDKTAESAAASPASGVPKANDHSVETSAAKPADEASSGKERPSEAEPRGKFEPPPGFLMLPAYIELAGRERRQRYDIDAAQEKELRNIADAFEAAQQKVSTAYKEPQKMPPEERKAKLNEIRTEYRQAASEARKRIENLLTAQQRADYLRDVRYNSALWFCADPWPACMAVGIELSQQQREQFDRLAEESREKYQGNSQKTNERLMAVLTPEQRERLLARFTDTDLALTIDVSGYMTEFHGLATKLAPPPLCFSFLSDRMAHVTVYGSLYDPAVRKELAVTADQEASLKTVLVKSQTAAEKIFDRYEPKTAAPKPSHEAQKSQQAEYRQALEQFGKQVVAEIDAVLQPRQVAELKAIARKNRAAAALWQHDRATLDDLHVTAEQRAKLWEIYRENAEPDVASFRARGEKALGILTPQQRKKLEDHVVRMP